MVSRINPPAPISAVCIVQVKGSSKPTKRWKQDRDLMAFLKSLYLDYAQNQRSERWPRSSGAAMID
jgi:hypothetical protein